MSVADHDSSRDNGISRALNGKYGLSVGGNTSSNSNRHFQGQSMSIISHQQAWLPKENHNNDHHQPQPSPRRIVGSKRPWQETKIISDSDGLYGRRNALAEASRASASAPTAKTHPIRPVSAFSLLNQERTNSIQHQQQTLHLIPPSLSNTVNTSRLAWLKLGHGITELAGEAGSGKSQIAMSLCVHAVMKQQKRAVYISLAGGQASLSRIAYRMQQIANAQLRQSHGQPSSNQSLATNSNDVVAAFPQTCVLSQILTHSVRNQEDLFSLLRQDLPLCLKEHATCGPSPPSTATANSSSPRPQQHRHHQPTEHSQQNNDQHPVAIVVLDSIADLFRLGNSDNPNDKAAILKRSYLLFDLAAILKELSDRYQVPMLVINQVTADFSSTGSSNNNNNNSLPALGLSWANCVNATYIIRRTTGPNNENNSNRNGTIATTNDNDNNNNHQYHSGRRHVFLAKSAKYAVNQKASFVIGPGGVEPIR